MTEVLFYHLQNMSVENVLPSLLEKSLERGWRVVVQATSQERADALDAHLWTYRDDSFLPHATWRAGDAQDQPIILATEEGNPNGANVRFLIDNAALPQDRLPTSAWCCCSTAMTRTRFRPRARPGRIANPAASMSPIGRPTRWGAGADAISGAMELMICWGIAFWCFHQPRWCRKVMVGQPFRARGGEPGSL